MIEKISTKILDLLQAGVATLIEGGADADWSGVKRPDTTSDDAAEGYVNLFDKSHDPDGEGHRPAIYVGTRGLEAGDGREFDVQSSGGRVELRIAQIPLVICVLATTKNEARRRRNQLRANVRDILQANPVVSSYWYGLETAVSMNPNDNKVWTTATGAGSQQVAEGIGVLWLSVRYSWTIGCDA